MFKKKILKVMVFTLILALIISSVGLSVSANSKYELKENKLPKIHGEFNFKSSDLTTVIVELNEVSIIEGKHKGINQSKTKLANARSKTIHNINSKINNTKVHREYDYVFSGFSLELPSNEVLQLLTMPDIKAIYPNVNYMNDQLGEVTGIEDDAISPLMMESAPFIGSSIAWDMGYKGEGITVAIIDTGVDYTHPDLAHAFGEYKGWDFVDNDADPQEGEGQYHGTHVAGTVAANGLIKGVAPKAKLLAYRVLGPQGGTTQDVVAGIEKAVQDGANVMNLSLGNSLNNPDWATSIALDWAMAEGVVAVTSNGNSGPNNWTVGSPGTSRNAISVGATQLPYDLYGVNLFTTQGVEYPSAQIMGYNQLDHLLALNENKYEFVYVGLGYPVDFEDKDLDGKIALISRGELAFVDKATNAKNAGAVGAIIFNHLAGEIPNVPGMAVPTVRLTNEDGKKILAELELGNNEVTFDINYLYEVGESMANFSSRGPVIGTWMIKPDVSAPGVNIVSTVPGGYGALQGTSMSSPHVAGAAALLLQANPSWSVEEVKSALMNTAENVYDETGKVYAHNSQGAGSIRVPKAIETQTLVLPGSHSFGVFYKNKGKQIEKQSFTIKNLTDKRKQYTFDVEIKGNPDGIKVNTANNIRVNAFSTQQVNFNVQVDAAKLTQGYYEGTIKVSDGEEIIEVPTILFVQEPDYPRITHGGIDILEEGYEIWTYLPQGAEIVDIVIYRDTPWEVVGVVLTETNVPKEFNEFYWDGTINGQSLTPGLYHVFIFAEKAGQTDYIYGGEFRVKN